MSTTTTTAQIEAFDRMLDLERLDTTLTALAVLGSDDKTRERNTKARKRNRDEMNRIIDGWDVPTLSAYGDHRRAARVADQADR